MRDSVAGIRGVMCSLALAALSGCTLDGNDVTATDVTATPPASSGGSSAPALPEPQPEPQPQPEPEPEPELPPVEEPAPDDDTPGSATLNWTPPTEFTDGSTLHDLGGYRIHYGTESGTYDSVIEIDNPGITSYVVEGLAPGVYYFAISAVTSTGAESAPSAEASKTI
jgi:hypothetical protein